MKKIYRRYRDMTEEEQKATGLETDNERIQQCLPLMSQVLGYEPFIVAEDSYESPKE